MTDGTGQLVIVYNGETYNYRQLREWLDARGHGFRTAGDTEVLLELYREEGPDFVSRLNGIFAFGLWDVDRKTLLIARDRVGIKPMYYWHDPATGDLLFGSDLGVILANPVVPRRIDDTALAEYLHFSYTIAPRTWIRDVRQLEPGQLLVWHEGRIRLQNWYRWLYEPREELASIPAATESLGERLTSAVESSLVSDVPVASFLSGGIDSCAVTALAQKIRQRNGNSIRAFTVRFWQELYDESARARAIARDIGCEHEEVDAQKLPFDRGAVDRIVAGLAEPFGDSSALAVYTLCEAARRFGKVALAGDGGDELFLGYAGMAKQQLAHRLRPVPETVRRLMADALGTPRSTWPRRLQKYLRLSLSSGADLQFEWQRRWRSDELARLLQEDHLIAANPAERFPLVRAHIGEGAHGGLLEQQLRFHIRVDLPSKCLLKVDRMSMAHGFEVRPPILSNEMLDFASELPVQARYRDGRSKEPLRSLSESLSATAACPSPKHGFGFPVDGWMKPSLAARWKEWELSDSLGRLGFRREAVDDLVARYQKTDAIGEAYESRRLASRLYDLLILGVWSQNTGARL